MNIIKRDCENFQKQKQEMWEEINKTLEGWIPCCIKEDCDCAYCQLKRLQNKHLGTNWR